MFEGFARTSRAVGMVVGLVSALVATVALPAAASAAGPLTTFRVQLYSSCINGNDAPANTDVRAELNGATGTYQGHFHAMTDQNGNWHGCFWGIVEPGESVTATIGNQSRTYVVQPLSLKVDRVSDVVSGKSAPDSSVEVDVMNCQEDWYRCTWASEESTPTNGNGAYSRDVSHDYNIRGGDYVQVHLASAEGDDQYVSQYAPQLNVWVGHSWTWGQANANSKVKAWIWDANGVQRARTTTKAYKLTGYFETTFTNTSGRSVDVRVNDTVTANVASDASLKAIDYRPVFDVANDKIFFHCFPNAPVYFYAQHSDGDNDSITVLGTSGPLGNAMFSTMAQGGYDLRHDDRVDIDCRNANGDNLEQPYDVP